LNICAAFSSCSALNMSLRINGRANAFSTTDAAFFLVTNSSIALFNTRPATSFIAFYL